MPTGVYKRKGNGDVRVLSTETRAKISRSMKAAHARKSKRLEPRSLPMTGNLQNSSTQNWLKQRALELAIEAERSLPASLPTESRSKIVDRAAEYWNFLRGESASVRAVK